MGLGGGIRIQEVGRLPVCVSSRSDMAALLTCIALANLLWTSLAGIDDWALQDFFFFNSCRGRINPVNEGVQKWCGFTATAEVFLRVVQISNPMLHR